MRHTSDWLVNGYVKSGVINKLWVGNCQSFEGMVREWGNREQRASWLNVKGRLRGLRQGGSRCVSEPRSKSLPNAKVDSLCQGPVWQLQEYGGDEPKQPPATAQLTSGWLCWPCGCC